MSIQHLTRQHTSRYFKVVEAKLPKTRQLRSDETIECNLGTKGGYPGCVRMQITDGSDFDAIDWKSADSTRFPARIKAAATALRDTGHRGRFEVAHDDGKLIIKLK